MSKSKSRSSSLKQLKLHTEKYLDVSTSHVTVHDMERLKSDSKEAGPDTLICYDYPEGAWVCCGRDAEIYEEIIALARDRGYSPEFIHLLELAYKAGCAYVRFDGEGMKYDGLRMFDW